MDKELADLLLPDIKLTPEDIYRKYPPRNLPEGAMVTRFAPSPTGMMTIGNVYAALIYERLAHQSGGVCYLRIEDTDKKREVKGSIADIIHSLAYFGICFDEGPTVSGREKGSYGPYKQSLREGIYKVFIKHLLEKGQAYPCFCSAQELEKNRKAQQETKARMGYYGSWARHRSFTFGQVQEEMAKGKPFVIRLRSPGRPENRIKYRDLIKGAIEMPENDQDIVIMKSDGLPTYHFAHAVDDYLMGTTHVIRADEWLSSVPLHLQLFDVLGFKTPHYGHIAPIMKQDGNSKRKLSKRKDSEAAAKYYVEQGFPGPAVTEYFINLINSGFEEWRRKYPCAAYTGFPIDIGRMSVSGALFDMNKLVDISKDVISRLRAEEVFDRISAWAGTYDAELAQLLARHGEYSLRIFNIERKGVKPRKDFAKWSDVKQDIAFFFDELFAGLIQAGYPLPSNIAADTAGEIVAGYQELYRHSDDKDAWFSRIKDLSEKLGFAREIKQYKKNPESYRGHVGDVAMVLRVAVTNRTNTPDLYEVMQVMGEERVHARLKQFMHALHVLGQTV